MKKLAINALNICDDISNIDSYLLVIKNKKILYKILSNSDLQYENSYIQILDENYKELKLSDYVDFISSIINLDSNSKKNLNVLIRRIKKEEIDIIAQLYDNFTGAELEQVCNKVKMDSIIKKEEISVINFVDYYLRYKHIVIDNSKEKIKYLNKMNSKLFSGTNLAKIFNYSKPYISQILKEDRE